MNELISIIVPVYNAEKTLERCVRPLMAQTYENIEILLVNDGSKDGSLGMCRKFAEEDHRVGVIDKPNGGVSSARNAGLDAARGEFVMFCDSDDWVEPDWCACMRENHVPGDLTVCQVFREDFPMEESEKQKPLSIEIAQRKDFLHYPMQMCYLYNKIYERSLIEEHHLRLPAELRLGEDLTFVLSYLSKIKGQVRFLSRGLYNYDVSISGSLSKRSPSMEQCDLFYHSVTDAMKEIGIDDKESIHIRDRFVLTQFEGMLTDTAKNGSWSFWKKVAHAKKTGNLESFSACDRSLIVWGNPLYNWCFHKKHMVALMLYLILRNILKS